MPNSFTNGLAQSIVGSDGTSNSFSNGSLQSSYNPSQRPWQKLNYLGNNVAGMANQAALNANGSYSSTGPNGAGWYSVSDDPLAAQQYYAQQFRQNIPTTENNLYNQAAGSVGAQTDQSLRNARTGNSSRGLLYGGINAGNEQGIRSQAASNLAQVRSNINSGVESAANQMDNSAISSGVAIQQQQQQMQNQIYANAMAQMNNSNAAISGLLGAAGAVVGGIYTGGAGAGAGYAIGSQAGKSLG